MDIHQYWDKIDTILLDMDGTVLDLHFDNVFWSQHLPQGVAQARSMPLEQAHAWMQGHFERTMHTLEFYCLDHWAELTELDICKMKLELAHLIRFRSGSERFLTSARAQGKQLLLVTNAHADSVAIKHDQTGLLDYFHHTVSSHDYASPKESQDFWARFSAHRPFDPDRTLFVDDNLTVLKSAQDWGVGHLATISQPDSMRPARDELPHTVVNGLDELLP